MPDEGPFDRALDQYLLRLETTDKSSRFEVREAFLLAYPQLERELKQYFAQEDGVADAMEGVLDSLTRAPTHRVLRHIGEYELQELLGRGGMGEVYKARQLKTGRLVAVKIMRHTAPLVRFRREIEIVAKLRHPNIVTLYEAGEDQGNQFYSMELVTGGSLSNTCDLSPTKVAELGHTLALALDYAHQQQILHRDIKPENILLDEQGQPMIADFGLARIIESSDQATATQDVVGTYAYMSPEQARGQNAILSPGTDVYALGATLYRLLTGHPPIQGPNPAILLRNIQTQEVVSPRLFNSAVPHDLASIILKSLRKEASDRYQNAAEMARHLKLFLEGKPVPIRPISLVSHFVSWMKREPILATLTLLTLFSIVLGSVVSIVFAVHANHAAIQATAAASSLESAEKVLKRELHFSRLQVANAYWNDGNIEEARRLLRLSIPADSTEDDLRNIEWYLLWEQCHQGTVLDDTLGGGATIAAATDGTQCAIYKQNHHIDIWNTTTWTKDKTLVSPDKSLGPLRGMKYFNDNRSLVTVHMHPWICIWDIKEGKLTSIIESPQKSLITKGMSLALDGKTLAILVANNDDDYEAILYDLDTRVETKRWKPTFKASSFAFSPDMKMYALGGYHGWEIRSFPDHDLVGKGKVYTADAYGLQFDPTGEFLLWMNTGYVHATNVATQKLEFSVLGHSGSVHAVNQLQGAPAERGYFVTAGSDGTIKVWDYSGRNFLRQFRGHTGATVDVLQVPGTNQFLSTSRDGTLRLWRYFSNVEKHRGLITNVSYTTDSRYKCVSTSENEVILVKLGTKNVDRLQDSNESWRSATISPNGRWVASFTQNGILSIFDVETKKVITTKWFPHTIFYSTPRFLPDGNRIVVAAHLLPSFPDFAERKQKREFPNLIIWNCETNMIERTLNTPYWGNFATEVRSDGVIATCDYQTVILTDTVSGKLLAELKETAGRSFAFSPDGRFFVTCNQQINVHDGSTYRLLTTAKGHSGAITSVAFLPDSSRLITGGADGRMMIWDSSTWTPVVGLKESSHPIDCVGATPNGKFLFSTRPSMIDFWPIADEERVQMTLRRGW